MRYIKQHHRSLYAELLMSGKSNNYLTDFDTAAKEMFFGLVKQMAKKQGVTKQMNAEN